MAEKTLTPPAAGMAGQQAAVVSCWMCGTRLHQDQMMPDGGSACGDIRWYCRDARACAERWTSARRERGTAEAAARASRA